MPATRYPSGVAGYRIRVAGVCVFVILAIYDFFVGAFRFAERELVLGGLTSLASAFWVLAAFFWWQRGRMMQAVLFAILALLI